MELSLGLVIFFLLYYEKCHFQTLNQMRRWLMDLETSFMGFIVTLEAKISGFWSNMATFDHMTHSSVYFSIYLFVFHREIYAVLSMKSFMTST